MVHFVRHLHVEAIITQVDGVTGIVSCVNREDLGDRNWGAELRAEIQITGSGNSRQYLSTPHLDIGSEISPHTSSNLWALKFRPNLNVCTLWKRIGNVAGLLDWTWGSRSAYIVVVQRMPLHVRVEVVIAKIITAERLRAVDGVQHCACLQDRGDIPLIVARPPHVNAGSRWETVRVHRGRLRPNVISKPLSYGELGTCMRQQGASSLRTRWGVVFPIARSCAAGALDTRRPQAVSTVPGPGRTRSRAPIAHEPA